MCIRDSYEMDGEYIRTRNFTDGTNMNLEAIAAFTDDDNYSYCFNIIHGISPELAEQYLRIVWMDTVCFNMDRHTQNFGFLRDRGSGEIVSMAPNYDNNIALISKGYPNSSVSGMISFFREFAAENETAREMLREMDLPVITKALIEECMDECPFEVNRRFITDFILNSQDAINESIHSEDLTGNEDKGMGLTL